ncbi:hypothetical protein AQS8620_00622 [Aquimixticola soesokkakensis]|uniref:DUF3500 domain-containing protein n=1 Tax=Aquimixticola soesokkakensis TaxID=1519096 RepID=A0A1Y5RTZ4_9RHOB|nr:DUF3500 domain-containing protein [Aquimixticola soesokkakensis]SLN22718.1 hypothetical protein AQS8620_00622 [Aquimixticola soesokkakensis]
MSHAAPSKTLAPLTDAKLKAAFGQMAHPRDFRPFVPAQKAPPALNSTRHQRTAEVMEGAFFQEQFALMTKAMEAPFVGVRFDGQEAAGTRTLAGNDAPIAEMTTAMRALQAVLRPEIAAAVCLPSDAPAWRRWHNMPMAWPRDGLGLEEMNTAERDAVMALLRSSLSQEGFATLQALLEINRFSGELIGREKYLNEFCYTVGLFGTPEDDAWGWQFYGHHICLSCRVVGDTYVLSPTLLAAEPTVVDTGPKAGINAFIETEEAALDLIRGLAPDLQARAIVLPSILSGDVPAGRRHWADSLHLGGAFRDNQIIPAEGVCAQEFTPADKARLMTLFETFFTALPQGPGRARRAEIEAHLDQTWLVWMGGIDDWSPFYIRLYSPVVLVELDHHQAVFLTNKEPARFHVHTITRTPNGGDYGMDLVAKLRDTK